MARGFNAVELKMWMKQEIILVFRLRDCKA